MGMGADREGFAAQESASFVARIGCCLLSVSEKRHRPFTHSTRMGSNYVVAFIAEKPHFIDAQSREELADSTRQDLAVWGWGPVTRYEG